MSIVRQPVLAQRVRQRLIDERSAQRVSQRELVRRINAQRPEEWSQSKLAKVLTGAVELKMDDVECIGEALGLTMVEVVRDRGLEFVADLAPHELRILERLRNLRPEERAAIFTILGIPPEAAAPAKRQTFEKHRPVGRPRNTARRLG